LNIAALGPSQTSPLSDAAMSEDCHR
jgi:hypothetical protein